VAGKFLVASADAGTRDLVRRAFSNYSIEAEECLGAMEAFAHLERRYDGVVLDCEDVELAIQLLTGLKGNSQAENMRVIALLPAETPVQQVLSAGAAFAIHKPVRVDRLATILRICFHLTTRSEKATAARLEQASVK
jgi:DNA-binding response OmpR family regulator